MIKRHYIEYRELYWCICHWHCHIIRLGEGREGYYIGAQEKGGVRNEKERKGGVLYWYTRREGGDERKER